MLQVVQDLKHGATTVEQVPAPGAIRGQLLIQTQASLVSAGTERMLLEFGRAGLLSKARQQPDKVRQVLDKARTDGIAATVRAVRSKLDQPIPMGYCSAGVVLEVGEGVSGFQRGDRVASNGPHAEVVSVPANLCARIPDSVSFDAAAFTVPGAISLQGIRLLQPTLGECVVVTGLGLIGQLAVQLLRAHGCRVLGIDPDKTRCELARQFGAEAVVLGEGEDPLARALSFSRGRGVDCVLITASTKSSEPVHQAATMCRKRGRIVLVGVTGLELSRADFYEKELTFQVSCSYGPGRYDVEYEAKGQDYPVGFVRWTAQRNFEAFLDVVGEGGIQPLSLVKHRFPIEEAEAAYATVADGEGVGTLLEYRAESTASSVNLRSARIQSSLRIGNDRPVLGIVGTGAYGAGVLVPAISVAGARLKYVASATGLSGAKVGRQYDAEVATTDVGVILDDPEVDGVVIATRHDTHADYVCRALEAGKHVFVEKPVAIDLGGLARVCEAYQARASYGPAPVLMVGFNRRFAPLILRLKRLLDTLAGPKAMVVTVNAGAVEDKHWTHDPSVGGGRIVGEACHFIDLLRYLATAPVSSYHIATITRTSGAGETATLTLNFGDGSIGTVHYFCNGHRRAPKERIEVFCGGKVLAVDNFRRLRGHGWIKLGARSTWKQDKGNTACVNAFVEAVRDGSASPIPFEEVREVSAASIELARMSQWSPDHKAVAAASD